MDTLILVGGRGKRIDKLSGGKPKPLIEINREPFLSILIRRLASYQLTRIILCTGYKSEYFEAYLSEITSEVPSIYSSEEDKSLGTAGAIKHAEGLVRSEDFLVINGDTFLAIDYNKFIKSFVTSKAIASMALTKMNKTGRYGLIKMDSQNKIISYSEKQESDNYNQFISAGLYLFNQKIFQCIPKDTNVSLEYDTLPLILKRYSNRVYGYYQPGDFIDIGTPSSLSRAHLLLRKYQINSQEEDY